MATAKLGHIKAPSAAAAAPAVTATRGTANLGGIKETRTDGREPWDPVPEEPAKRRRIAWPGGKISSNKDEALVAYFSKKLERGEALTETQRTAFEHATKGTRFEGKSETECMRLAAEEKGAAPAPEPAAAAEPAPTRRAKAGGRGRGRGNKGAKAKGARGRGGAAKAKAGRGRGRGGNKQQPKKAAAVPLTKRLDGSLSVGR